MIYALFLIPAVFALAVLVARRQWFNKLALLGAGLIHLALVVRVHQVRPPAVLNGWFGVDALGLLFLSILSVLFLASAVYAAGYLRRRYEARAGATDGIFVSMLLFFLSAATMVTLCQHFELLWVGIEATTLSSAPLIYFHRSRHSIEATWKYLVICSIGIALALFGNFFLAISVWQPGVASEHSSMLIQELASRGAQLNAPWLKTAFVFLFVGYGTKMGLAPMHTWKPDAYSEAPSLVSALLAGALINCTFLGILRTYQVCVAAGHAGFAQSIFVFFGLLSMAFATVFIVRQTDFKRLLAYSSVEHAGILSLSVGLGGSAVFGGMLHSVGHSLVKSMLFLVAGNLLAAYRSKMIVSVRGAVLALPYSGVLWIAGLLAITGAPPFGIFASELTILKSALDEGRFGVAALYLFFLAVIFIAMIGVGIRMSFGSSSVEVDAAGAVALRQEKWWSIMPPLALGMAALVLGLWIPSGMTAFLSEAAHVLTGQPMAGN